MNLFKKEYEKETKALGFKSLKRVVKTATHQTGGTTRKRDIVRDASAPGKRRSKLGKIYYEYRKNRSDLPGESI